MKKIKNRNVKTVSSLKELVYSSHEYFGSKTLYEYKVSKESKKYSYTDLYTDMNSFGTALAKRGYVGKTVALIGDTTPYWSLTYLTVTSGNGTIVPLDRELSEESICDFINLSECSVVAYTGSFNGKIAKLADKIPGVTLFIRLNEDTDGSDNVNGVNIIDISTLLDEGKALMDSGDTAFTSIEPDTEKCCSILFTSGTTGTSKGVMLSQKNITTSVNAACQAMPYDSTTTLVSLLPIHHTYEFTATHLGGMNIGASIYINPALKYASRSMQYYKPTAITVVPLFLETVHKKVWTKINENNMAKKVKFGMKVSKLALLIGIDLRKKLFSDVRAAFGGNINSIVCGGAPLSEALVKDFYAFGLPIYEGYGITECSPLVSVNPYYAPRMGSVGTPVNGTEVKIDASSADESGRGEILVRGGNVMLGYYKNPEATAEVFTEDGWFRTGDIGYTDSDGYIYITGRKKNVIILSNGKNVYPEEIEEKLSSCSYVKEIVVIGRKDTDGSETSIVAVVYPDFESFADLSAEEVKERANTKLSQINAELPSFKQVSSIEFRDEEFEKTTTKKIKRFLVK